MREAFESMLDGVVILSPVRSAQGGIVDFRYEYINEAGCRLNRMPRERHLGQRLREVLPGFRGSGLFDDFVRVVQTGQPIIANDLPHDTRFYNPAAASEGLLAGASVPLIAGGKIIGTLDAHSKTDRQAFTLDHIRILSMLASQAAIAIENARLYEGLQGAHAELEVRVQQRTAELAVANAQLQQEMIERQRVEERERDLAHNLRIMVEADLKAVDNA